MFIEKYKPSNLSEYVGQKEAVSTFLKWIEKWEKGSKALLFHGPPGTGKTSLIHAYAKEKNLDLIEVNASDYRSAKQLQEILGKSMFQQSLIKRGKIFLIDEIDGLAGREDHGGIKAIIDIIKNSLHPIVLIAGDPWTPKLRYLRSFITLVPFGKHPVWDIEKKLKIIGETEKIKIDNEILRQFSKNVSGDMRAAINDFEILSVKNKNIESFDLNELGFRDSTSSIFDTLKIIFKSSSILGAKLSINNSDKDPEEIFWWIENNVLNEYENPDEIAKAYDALSKADIFRQRIRSRQNWSFLAYFIDMMTAGVSQSKNQMYKKFSKYQYPQNIHILAATKGDRQISNDILIKLSRHLHCSVKKTRQDFLPYFRILLKHKKSKEEVATFFNLSKEDIETLRSV